MLKSSMSLLLSFSILIQGLNFHLSDMIELQVLLNHLKEHQASYGDDVFTFFEKHYGDLRQEHDQEKHKGSSEHEKLPFKHKVCHLNMSILINSLNRQEQNPDPVPIASVQNYFYLDNYSFLDQTDIFQPPKFL